MKKYRISVLMHRDFLPPDSIEGLSDQEIAPWKTEYDVTTALRAMGHEVRPLGVVDDLAVIRDTLHEFKPDVVFNLLEEFNSEGTHVPYLLGYLELLKQSYTGCNPRGLILSDSKPLMKKILRHHRIPMPDFAVFPRARTVKRPRHLNFPLIVKSTTEHGSVGISQASVVHDDDKLRERVEFIHGNLNTDAIAEEYIEGREVYVGMMGNQRLQVFPIWELHFENLTNGTLPIATAKAKWDLRYQKKVGLKTKPATNLPNGSADRIVNLCRRVYRILGLSGYARVDLRVTESGKLYLLEPNPNPNLAYGEDFAESAEAVGLKYADLLHRILNLGLRYQSGQG